MLNEKDEDGSPNVMGVHEVLGFCDLNSRAR